MLSLGDAADIDWKTLLTTAEVATGKAEYLVEMLNPNTNGSCRPSISNRRWSRILYYKRRMDANV